MKLRLFTFIILFVLAAEFAVLVYFAAGDTDYPQDTVMVNEVLHTVQAQWDNLENHQNRTGLDYVVLDEHRNILFRTREGLSESIHAAIAHRDTLLEIRKDQASGLLIIYNDSSRAFRSRRQTALVVLLASMAVQCAALAAYAAYLNHAVIRPFHRLKSFAQRIAGGNLDIPLTMDRQNLFGPFTEAFDLMRTELKHARQAEAEANAGKKELVARLSHEIKTPVASIKAASEVGFHLTDNEKIKNNYTQIIRKADQINTLVTNLFTATLEELSQLTVTPADMSSRELAAILEDSDYLGRAVIPPVPDCLIRADRLRLQQVFDNLFSNSYKYADTEIKLEIRREGPFLAVTVEDSGGGVPPAELPLLKEKFKRGSNSRNTEGAGLGLFISDYFMGRMQGELLISNGSAGLQVTVRLLLSGTEDR